MMPRGLKRLALFAIPVAAAASVLAFTGARAAAPNVKVGYLIPLSGTAAASIGQDMRRGTLLAVKHINDGGGIKSLGGARLELVQVDTHGDPKVGITEAERLITVEKVPVIIGAFQSAVTFPATAVAEKYRIPWIVDLAAKTEITERGFRYVFRPTQIPSSGNADSVVDFIKWASDTTGKKPRTAAIVYENTDWGQDLAKTMRTRLPKEMGVDIVLDESYPPNSPDLRPLVLKVKGKNPDVVSVTSYTADAIQIHKLFEQMQVNAMGIIGSGAGQADRAFVPGVGGRAAHMMFTTNGWAGYESAVTTPFARRFWDEFVGENKYEPTEFSVVAYGAVWVLKDALERAAKAEPEAIRDALAKTAMMNTDVTKLLGFNVKFDDKGQNPLKRFVVQQVADGKYRTVWPPEVAAKDYKIIWPVPSWSDRK